MEKCKQQSEIEMRSKQQSEIKMRHLPAVYRIKALWGVRVGVAIFLDQSIGIDET